jgi:RNA polymerase sigma factor (sigma-70 family)
MNPILRPLCNLLDSEPQASDCELLRRFASLRDEAAFAQLVQRHGPLVLGVCRRALADTHVAEDVFQAAFLVLARRAGTIRKAESVGSWLYGVAQRLSLQARQRLARQRAHEGAAPGGPSAGTANRENHPVPLDLVTAMSNRELLAALDTELKALPVKYQSPLILCYLEGKSHEQAAQQLDWALGTLKTRLARARTLLRQRLARRGFALSTAGLVTLLGQPGATASVTVLLAKATAKAAIGFTAGTLSAVSAGAATLAEGMLKTILLGKLKASVLCLVALALMAAGAGALVLGPTESPPSAAAQPPAVVPAAGGNATEGRDRFDDALPPGALVRLGTVRWRHGDAVNFAQFLSGGKLLTVADDNKLRIWDSSGKELRQITLETSANPFLPVPVTFAVSPDGRQLATSASSKQIRTWDLQTGKETTSIKGLTEPVTGLAFSRDSKVLMVTTHPGQLNGESATLFVEFPSGKVLRKLQPPSPGMQIWPLGRPSPAIVASPSGKTMILQASVPQGKDQNINSLAVFDVATGKTRLVTRATLLAPALSPDDSMVAGLSLEGVIQVLDLARPLQVRKLPGGIRGTITMLFSPDSQKLWAKRAGSGQIIEWDPRTGKELRKLGSLDPREANPDPGNDPVPFLGYGSALALSPDGKTLVAGGDGNSVRFYDVASGKETTRPGGHSGVVSSIHLAPGGNEVLTQSEDGTVRRWLTSTGEEKGQLHIPKAVLNAVLSPDGTTLAVHERDHSVSLRDVASGKERGKIKADAANPPAGFAFSPNGQVIAAYRGRSSRVTLHNRAGKETGAVAIQGVDPTGAAVEDRILGEGPRPIIFFAADSRFVAVRTKANTLSIMHADSGERLHKLTYKATKPLRCGAFSPDGRTVALDFGGGYVQQFELASEQLRREFGKPSPAGPFGGQLGVGIVLGDSLFPGPLTSVPIAFAPDGRLLALGIANRVQLLDVETGAEVRNLTGHQGAIQDLVFAADGKKLLSASADTTALIWNMAKAMPAPAPQELTPAQLGQAWQELLEDASKAAQAARQLRLGAGQSVPFMKKQLRATRGVDPKILADLIGNLGSQDFKTRDQATRDLEKLGELAIPALRRELEARPGLEVQRRLKAVLGKVTVSKLAGEALRYRRAIEVLEHIGNSEARGVLADLAKGATGARVTEEARAALARLAAR